MVNVKQLSPPSLFADASSFGAQPSPHRLSLSFWRKPVEARSAKAGRDERIRTSGPLVPNQVRYQTAPHPETKKYLSLITYLLQAFLMNIRD